MKLLLFLFFPSFKFPSLFIEPRQHPGVQHFCEWMRHKHDYNYYFSDGLPFLVVRRLYQLCKQSQPNHHSWLCHFDINIKSIWSKTARKETKNPLRAHTRVWQKTIKYNVTVFWLYQCCQIVWRLTKAHRGKSRYSTGPVHHCCQVIIDWFLLSKLWSWLMSGKLPSPLLVHLLMDCSLIWENQKSKLCCSLQLLSYLTERGGKVYVTMRIVTIRHKQATMSEHCNL